MAGPNGYKFKRQRQQQLFSLGGPLDIIAIDTLDSLSHTRLGKQFVVITTYQYSKLTRTIVTSSNSSTFVAYIFLKHSVIIYEIPNIMLTDNG